MPELPEVETICRELRKTIEGDTIIECEIFRPDYLRGGDAGFFVKSVSGRLIVSVERRGKFIIWNIGNGKIISHLGMTGKYIVHDEALEIPKHTVAKFKLKNKTLLLNDVRRFGRLNLYMNGETIPVLEMLGVEPFSENFDLKYISTKFKDRKRPVKELLLDQSIIAGIGNIYASEILYRARIHPLTSGSRLSNAKLIRLIDSTKSILESAVENAGTTISDYRRIDEKTGNFQNFLKVYGKDGCLCESCQKEIKKIVFGGRSAYFCSGCQKK